MAQAPLPGSKPPSAPVPTPQGPKVAEIFPGFQLQFTSAEQKLQAVVTKITTLQQRQTVLTKQLGKGDDTSTTTNILASIALGEPGLMTELHIPIVDEDVLAESTEIGLQVDQALTEMESANWQLMLLTVLPRALASPDVDVDTLDDIFGLLPEYSPSFEDRAFAQQLLENLGPSVQQVVESGVPKSGSEIEQVMAALQRKQTATKGIFDYNPDAMTIDEIMSSIRTTVQTNLPPGVTTEDVMQMLREQGLNDPQVRGLTQDTKLEVEYLVRTYREVFARTGVLREDARKFGTGEMQSAIEQARWTQAVSQPGLLLFKPVEYWMAKFPRPTAAGARLLLALAEPGEQEVERLFALARDEEGLGTWSALNYTFEHWDTNAFAKFALEVIFDPLTYFGFGFYSKPLKLIPFVGRHAAAAALRAEQGYVRLAELPFEFLKVTLAEAIPKTLGVRATAYSIEAFDVSRAWIQRVTGRELSHISTDEAANALKVAVIEAMKDPQAPGLGTRAGLFMLGEREITSTEVEYLMRLTGSKGVDITPELLNSVNHVVEYTAGFGVTKFLRPNETAVLLRQIIGAADNRANLKVLVSFLETTRLSLQGKALRRLEGENPLAILRKIMDGAREDYLGAATSKIANQRYQEGIWARSLESLDRVSRLVFTQGIDKWFTTPMARAYLLFAAYAPFNILENVVKTMLAGINPLYRSGQHQIHRAGIITHGLQRVPIEIGQPTQFVAQLGAPESAFRKLSQTGVQLTRRQRKEAERDVRLWIEQAVAPRFLQRWSGYELGANIGGAERHNYVNGTFTKLLQEREPDVVHAVAQVVEELTVDLPKYTTRKYVNAYRQELLERLLTGNMQLVRNLVTDFTPGSVRAAEVSNIIEPLTAIGADIFDLVIRKAYTGELFTTGTRGVEDLFDNVLYEMVWQRFFESPAFFRQRFGEFVDNIITWTPTNVNDLNYKMNVIEQVVGSYGELINSSLVAAQAYSKNIPSPVVKGAFWDGWWNDRVLPHIVHSADDIERMIASMKEQLDVTQIMEGLTPEQRPIYLELLDKHLESVAYTADARTAQHAVELSFAPIGGARGNRWKDAEWQAFYVERDRVWSALQESVNKQQSDTYSLVASIPGMVSPTRIEPLQKPLATTHVAALFGVSPTELSSNMYLPELLVMRGKKSFTSIVTTRANVAGQRLGKTADELGYTQSAIHRVYDNIMRTIRADPSVEQGIEPMLIQLANAKEEIIRLGMRKQALVRDDTHQYLADVLLGREAIIEPFEVADRHIASELATEVDIVRVREAVDDAVAKGMSVTAAKNLYGDPDSIIVGQTQMFPTSNVVSTSFDVRIVELKGRLEELAVRTDRRILDMVQEWFNHSDNEALQNLGRLATESTEYQRGIQQILRERYPSGFIRIFRGQSKRDIPHLEGRDFVNVTSSRETAIDFEALRWVGPVIETDEQMVARGATLSDIVVSIGDVVAIASVDESELIIPAKVLLERIAQPIKTERVVGDKTTSLLDEYLTKGTITQVPQDATLHNHILKTQTSEWQATRQQVMDDVNLRWSQDFPDYSNPTAFTSLMKQIFPFWTYEAHRLSYIPREFIRHPGTAMALGKYMDNTDSGYIHVPGTSLEINPLRGTILMGGMRRLFIRDYPEFYDQFGGVAAALDTISRVGFYPGFPVGITMATFGAANGVTQFGEVMPAWTRTLTGAVQAIASETSVAKFLVHIAPDRYRDFNTAQMVSMQGMKDANGRRISGVAVLEKRLRDEPLTDEEQTAWDQGVKGIGWFTILAEQTSLFRLRPEEKIQVHQAADQIISEQTGIPVAILTDLRKYGLRLEDVIGPLHPDVQYALNSLEMLSYYTGAAVALMPSELGEQILVMREFWQNVAVKREELTIGPNGLASIELAVRQGLMSMDDWVYANSDISRQLLDFIESQKLLSRYAGIPMKLEERVEFAREHKMLIPIFHPIEELRQLYFSEPLVTKFNYDTGQIGPDWDTFFAFRNALEQSLPDDILGDLIRLNQREDTMLQRTYYQVNRNLFRPYNELFDIVLKEFPVDEQRLILEHREAEVERAQIIQEETTTLTGAKLVSEFSSRLQLAHQNLRSINPELDAWLNVFERVKGFESTEARSRYRTIRTELGLPIVPDGT